MRHALSEWGRGKTNTVAATHRGITQNFVRSLVIDTVKQHVEGKLRLVICWRASFNRRNEDSLDQMPHHSSDYELVETTAIISEIHFHRHIWPIVVG